MGLMSWDLDDGFSSPESSVVKQGGWKRSSPSRAGSALLVQRLHESLENFERLFGAVAPPQGRHHTALRLLDEWNQGPGSLDDATDEDLRRLADAHRLAWETYVITVTAGEDRRNRRTPFTANRLRAMMGGSLHGEGRKTSPRNTQFELYVAATFRLPGATVFDGEPDLRLLYGTEEVGIAVKRIQSLNVDQVQKNARKAEKQIATQGLRGWIALNLDRRFQSVQPTQDEAERIQSFNAAFDSVRDALRRPAAKDHVLGFILFGYIFAWSESSSGLPRLDWAPPVRWQALVDDPGEARLFQQFGDSLHARWECRVETILRKDFTGRL